jgi:glycerol-3-phosphate dehydrogenase (NAD(P)+)
MTGPLSIALLGAGNWGTTLADLAARNGHDVRLWLRDEAVAEEIRTTHTNSRSVPGLAIDTRVHPTTSLEQAVRGADFVMVVIPAQAVRTVARALGDVLAPEQPVIHGTKGLEIGTLRRVSEILREETCARQIGVLSGPNLAAEVARRSPAGTVVASPFPRVVALGRHAFSSALFRVFAGDDVLGVELAGALKNVVALAAGMATAMELGENAKALLITRGSAEIAAIARAMGGRATTFAGLAGIGDLLVTCASPLSRNHRAGAAMAKGMTLEQAVASIGQVAEGVHTARAAKALAAAHGVDAPLLERVHRVLYDGLAPKEALRQLMRLPPGHEAR